MAYTTLLLDLDDTLYPSSNGLWAAIRARMDEYMRVHLSLPEDQIPELRKNYFIKYGTTLRGLQIHHQVEAENFLDFVHDLPVEDVVADDPALVSLLNSLPQAKFIFTNADRKHALRVLKALGISECIQEIIDVKAMNYVCKPDPLAYRIAMQIAGESDPHACVYLDDSVRNLAPAQKLGLFTVLVGDQEHEPVARITVQRPHDLRQAMPELWMNHR